MSTENLVDPTLPPIGEGPRRAIVITIEVTEDFEQRLDNQQMVEREIHADRWTWDWAAWAARNRAGEEGRS